MILKKTDTSGLILPVVLFFLLTMGMLALLCAYGFAFERTLSENVLCGEREELVRLSALEHARAIFEAAEIWRPGSWPAGGKIGPFRLEGSEYYLELSPLPDNLAYQEFFDGTEWAAQTSVPLAEPRRIVSAGKRENKGLENETLLFKMALTLSDACDENHALNEAAGICGAEAVDFSEILSDDGSELRFAYRANAVYGKRAVTSLPYFYGNRDYDSTAPLTEAAPGLRELFEPKAARYVLKDECQKQSGLIKVKLSNDPIASDTESAVLRKWQKRLGRPFPVNDLWQNSHIAFFGLAVKGITPRAVHAVAASDGDSVYLRDEPGVFNSITNGSCRFAQLRGWVHCETLYAEAPRQALWLAASDLRKDTYYRVQIQDANFPVPQGDNVYGTARSKKLIARGSIQSLEEAEAKNYVTDYASGKPLKTDRNGSIELILKSPRDCSPKNRVRINSVYFRRPDIVSVVNRSEEPIFLSNWKLTAQTGEGSYLLGTLPCDAALPPGARFYLTDSPEIPREEYGFQKWRPGGLDSESVIALPEGSWGLDYEISSVKETKKGAQYLTLVGCKNAFWEKDELMDEVAELKDGLRFPIEGGNTKTTLIFPNLRLERYAGIREGDRLKILGLPRHVEYASLTLKNEYSQVAARTRGIKCPRDAERYASLLKDKDVWRLNPKPFSDRAKQNTGKYYDRPLTNGFEVLTALENRDAELGDQYASSRSLCLFAKEFPARGAGYRGYWQLAGGKAERQGGGLFFEKGDWPLDFWRGQKLRVMEGELKGEVFAVTGSVRNAVLTEGVSLPGKRRLKDFREGLVSLGPGYRDLFYTAAKNNSRGEWTFSNLWDCVDGELYLKGLCDAIDSGEFLEENHNALVTPELFDWENNAWEKFPPFRFQKNDAAYLTMIKKSHVSPRGCLKLRLTAQGLDDPQGSGRAWFGGIAVCPKLRPMAVRETPKTPQGPIPLTIPPALYSGPPLKYYLMNVSIGSRTHRHLMSVGPLEETTGRRKLRFQKLP